MTPAPEPKPESQAPQHPLASPSTGRGLRSGRGRRGRGRSAFTGVIASIPAGILADRFGKRRMLVLSSLLFATAPLLYLFVTQIWQLALVRFYHGFATAVFLPVGMALVPDLFHKERGEKMGWFSTSTLVGRLVAPVVGGGIIGMLVFNPGLSYKVVYLICGAAGVITLLLAFKLLNSIERKKEAQSWGETLKVFRTVISNRGIIITSAVEY